MAEPEKKKTKVRAMKAKSAKVSPLSQRLKDLQKAIDQGVYKISSVDIAKAYLYKCEPELNDFPSEKHQKEEKIKAREELKVVKKS